MFGVSRAPPGATPTTPWWRMHAVGFVLMVVALGWIAWAAGRAVWDALTDIQLPF
jgi:hypothetical protein